MKSSDHQLWMTAASTKNTVRTAMVHMYRTIRSWIWSDWLRPADVISCTSRTLPDYASTLVRGTPEWPPPPATSFQQGEYMSSGPRNVVITGANRGIGRAIAERFVAAGDNVATIYRGGDLPEGVFGAVADMREAEAIDAAFTRIEEHQGLTGVL